MLSDVERKMANDNLIRLAGIGTDMQGVSDEVKKLDDILRRCRAPHGSMSDATMASIRQHANRLVGHLENALDSAYVLKEEF